MRKETFNYPSQDKQTEIHAVRWIPDGDIRGILQIAHGMVEYIERYEAFATYLTEKGFLVTGNDHLGHGQSVTSEQELAHFPKQGNKILLADMHSLRHLTEEKYPGIPYFMMGHSMGSFLTRQYICMRGEGLKGTIIMGTGDNPGAVLAIAKGLAKIKGAIQGQKKHSKLLTSMAFGSYNKKIKDPVSKNAWLSRDDAQVKKYDDDPLCGLLFTNQAFAEMFTSIQYLKNKANLKGMPKSMPVLFVSGEEDPVGAYGKAVQKIAEQFKELGMEDVKLILYGGARHEVLNELNKEEVYEDLANWLEGAL